MEFVILGIEGQERIHYAMPMRVMGYDYGTYKKQYEANAAKYKDKKDLTEKNGMVLFLYMECLIFPKN